LYVTNENKQRAAVWDDTASVGICSRLFRGGFHLHTARSQLEEEEEEREARNKPAYYGILSGPVSLYFSASDKTTNV
jgi:hypothetical protein